jgi:hypothetical protein
MPQLSSLLFPILALIVALIVVAGLWYWWTSNQPEGEEHRPDQPEQTTTPEASPSGAERASALFSSLKSSVQGLLNTGTIEVRRVGPGGVTTSTEMIEVLRLYRDLSNGALVVQIGRQKYYSLDEIAEPQVRRRFLGNAESMAQFAQLKKGTSPLIDWSAPAPTVNQARPAYPVDSQTIPDNAPLPPPPISSSAPTGPRDPMAPPPPFSSKPDAAQTGSGKKAVEEAPPKSIADEIEDLLQYRLALDPVFAHRSIHIRSADDGSIVVQVDDIHFDGVGDVKDDDVRAFLQRVVQEWEARK